jgi:hypothetical protein
MVSLDPLHAAAAALVDDSHVFRRAAERDGSHLAAPAALESLQEALRVLSSAWYRLAADAAPDLRGRDGARGAEAGPRAAPDGLSREQEVRLMGAVHDVAAAFAQCARACRHGGSTAAPVISHRIHAERAGAGELDGEISWFARTVDRTRRGSVRGAGSGERVLR